ncbi:efflux RND transporter permease subunit [bacterium]|nr:efflux RND transporter permease subunit [bacterium]
MWLTNVSIRRPIFITMFVLALIVLGIQSRSRMPQEYNPKVDIPYITITTIYTGAGPNEIETLVTEPVEKAVTSTGNLKNVTSTSQDGVSTVIMEFEMGTDLEAAAADVRDKVSAIRSNLPDDADDPKVVKLDISSSPVMIIGLEGNLPSKEMRILADDVIADKLAKVGGVASVNVFGGDEREISVAVNKDRLDAYGIGIGKIVEALKASNLNVPAGSIKEGPRDYSVRTVGEYKSAKEIENTRIYVAASGSNPAMTIRVGDIAEVKDTVAEAERVIRLNGKPTVIFAIQKQSDANTVDVADGIKKELAELQPQLPSGVHPVIAIDQSTFVKDALHDVNKSLMEGILLVVVIVFLFLHTARATFIVAIAIPTSIFATYIPVSAFGFTQNQMVMLALSLVVGILVDDSIVILENIERHLRMREKPKDAALNGRAEIGGAAVAITMVDIVVFLPIAFMGGIVGQFFRQFGVTVAVATAFSLFMSFTLTPMLASRWMKSEMDKERDEEDILRRVELGSASFKDKLDVMAGKLFNILEGFLKGLDRKYLGILEWALHNRFLTIVIGFVSLLVVFSMVMPLPKAWAGTAAMKTMAPRVIIALIALGLAAFAAGIDRKSKGIALGFGIVMAVIALTIYLPFGFGFFPNVDQGQFSVTVRTAPGTSLVATDRVIRQVEKILADMPEMKTVHYKVSDARWYKPTTWFSHHTETQKGFYFAASGTSGSGATGSSDTGPQYGFVMGKVVDKNHRSRSIGAIVEYINKKAADIPGAELISASISTGVSGPTNNIQKEVQGQYMDDIFKEANRVAAVMEKVPGAVDVDVSYKPIMPERRIIVDKLKASKLGLSVSEIATAARTAIDGNDDVKLRDSGTEYPIRVHYVQSERNKTSDVDNLIVATKDGAPIYLRDVADVKYDHAPTKITRKNRQRVIYVTANIAQGSEMGNVNQAIDMALKKAPLVPGTSIGTGGSTKMMTESFGYMISALLLAIVLVYMLMGALFESFLTPFVIMFSLPQAMIGALLALLLTGKSMSIVSMIGIIMLMGLVTKNAILLVDYTNTVRSRGKNRHEALLEAGPTRLRPILMTTLAMIGGMTPTALALSQGSETRSPMAIAVIGGLIVSTLLTLIVIPVVYTVVDDSWQGLLKIIAPKSHKKEHAADTGELDLEPVGVGSDEQ